MRRGNVVPCCRTACLEDPQSKDGLSVFGSQNRSWASLGSDRTRWSSSVSLLCPSDLSTATTLSSASVASCQSSHQDRLHSSLKIMSGGVGKCGWAGSACMMCVCCEGGNWLAYSLVFDSLMPWILCCRNPERRAVVSFNDSNLSRESCLPSLFAVHALMLVYAGSICIASGGEYAQQCWELGLVVLCLRLLSSMNVAPLAVIRRSCMEQEKLGKHTCLLCSLDPLLVASSFKMFFYFCPAVMGLS